MDIQINSRTTINKIAYTHKLDPIFAVKGAVSYIPTSMIYRNIWETFDLSSIS
ncbi:hypothetical protein HMPREF3038_02375 [Akkermansia sp. KLE1797]|nr:hypothetical protein HMPREF3038_02375 [Akkermansia sp. KLE1797]KXU54891.1 hypothetical protein HMPREF3039_01041 [Akkermansia sp. KLE1798]KZA06274.1 hypothetical protein HMPREF1326_00125 [Akkermansia sp. KLE1605]